MAEAPSIRTFRAEFKVLSRKSSLDYVGGGKSIHAYIHKDRSSLCNGQVCESKDVVRDVSWRDAAWRCWQERLERAAQASGFAELVNREPGYEPPFDLVSWLSRAHYRAIKPLWQIDICEQPRIKWMLQDG